MIDIPQIQRRDVTLWRLYNIRHAFLGKTAKMAKINSDNPAEAHF